MLFSRSGRVGRAITALLVLSAAGLPACGSTRPSGYVGVASNAAVYVSWIRLDGKVTGQLTQALADKAGDGTVDTTRIAFTGTVQDDAVSLRLEQGLGITSALTGTLDGDALKLDYPGQDGSVITITLREGDGDAFNQQLAQLRDQTAQIKVDADQRAANEAAIAEEEVAQEHRVSAAAGLADRVRSQIAGLNTTAENATGANPALFEAGLETVRSSLENIKNSYQVLQTSIENGFDTVCDDAQIVTEDVTLMEDDIATLREDAKASSDPSVLDDDIRELRASYHELVAIDPALLPADAPTKAEVDRAIRKARRKVRGAGGADFDEAGRLFAQATALKAKADAACASR